MLTKSYRGYSYFLTIFTSHSAKAKSSIFAAFGTIISFNASQNPNAWSPIDVIVSGDYNINPFAGVILDRAAISSSTPSFNFLSAYLLLYFIPEFQHAA